jgi:hypothetical protein
MNDQSVIWELCHVTSRIINRVYYMSYVYIHNSIYESKKLKQLLI